MKTVLFIMTFMLLAYYLWVNWSYIINQPIVLGLLLVGILLWLGGIVFYGVYPEYASLAKLFGIVLFFTGIAMDVFKRSKDPEQ